MKRIAILFIFLIIVTSIGYMIYQEGTLPVNKSDVSKKMFVIKPGENINSIINNLSKEGLIRNKIVFYAIIKQLGIEKKIQAGDFALSPSMDAYQIANTLTHGTVDTWLKLIEGWRKEEVAQEVSKTFGIPEVEFINLAEEGYLFPDSYLIPTQATSEQIITILTNTFNTRFTDDMRQKAKERNLTEREVVILASLLEREAKTPEDKQMVASILLRRLEMGMKLQVDATVQYVLGYQPQEKRWWKEHLTYADLEIDSPYNTYKYEGIPPAPICNPGLAALQAVVNASPDTPYLFYLSEPSGKMHYSATNDEHNQKVQRYLR